MSDFFRFKEFRIYQKGAAAKVGTDAMLLGAWVKPGTAENILDIGTGTGVLALMMSQKCEAMIDAVEIEEKSAGLAAVNFEASPWSYRIQLFKDDFNQYAQYCTLHYNLIVSNPPFFSRGYDEGYSSESRRQARSQSALSYNDLLTGVQRLLSDDGYFALIIPAEQEEDFIKLAALHGLYPCSLCRVSSFENSPPKRLMLSLAREKEIFKEQELIIYRQPGRYSQQYIDLTQDFHGEKLI
jgi:tRNA1Val (adenine37-N6)-methyltransferase